MSSAVSPALTANERVFVAEYLKHRKGAAAYRAAFPKAASTTARNEAPKLLRKPAVAAAVAAGIASLESAARMDAQATIRWLEDVAAADPRELMQVWRVCCRFCWGKSHRYQMTGAEFERALAAHSKLIEENPEAPPFDEQGGTGYHIRNPINPDCPECFGDGVERVIFHDTRTLSPAAARLFAGVKVTKDGFEVKTHDQLAAARDLGRHFGLFTDNVKFRGKVDHTHDAVGELREFLRNRSSRLPISCGSRDE